MDYQVKAIRAREVVELTVSALSVEDAFLQAKSKGYIAISAKPSTGSILQKSKRVFPLVLFARELVALIDAGLNLVETIETLALKEKRKDAKVILDDLLQSLYQGQTFSNALQKQAQIFPMLFIATVKASETTGDMSASIKRFIAYEEQIGLLRKKIINASIYPTLLLVVGGLVILFLMGFVVPKFSRIYEGTDGELPFLSQLLLSWGNFLDMHGTAMLIFATLIGVALFFAVSQPIVRSKAIGLIWKIPTFGKKLRVYQLARFYRTLGMLLKGGVPILTALETVSGLLDVHLQRSMKKASLAISEGLLISDAMSKAELTTPVASKMLAVGERGGNISDMMDRIADFYDEELSRWIDWFTRLFEPILMLMIGLVIGVVVLLLYMPIFELAGSL